MAKKCCSNESKKEKVKSAKKDDRKTLATYTKALGHPVRMQILEILKAKKNCICGDLVNELPVAQATVSQHLKVLKDAGFIRGTISGPAICYCIDEDTLQHFKNLVLKF